jgi:hypothetical protein
MLPVAPAQQSSDFGGLRHWRGRCFVRCMKTPRAAQWAASRHGIGTVIAGLVLGSISACGSAEREGEGEAPGTPGSQTPDPSPLVPSTQVTLSVAPAVLDPILTDVEQAQSQTAESLLAASAVAFQSSLGFDPTTALGLPLIQQSALALNDAELAKFAENGFVILRRKQYPSFPYGYFDIYGSDLPVYVTADMVLEAVHRSYDDMLQAIELVDLAPRLGRLLTAMRGRLAAGDANLSEQAAQDADFFLSVAASLLAGQLAEPVTGRDATDVRTFLREATAASGARPITIFDTVREIDFSQFEPRGHYAGIEPLERYFRAMMWLGRIDLRMIETLGDGSRRFWRRQLETALALGALLDASSQEDWRVIDATVGAFVGEHDYMTVPQLGSLLEALGTTPAAGLGALSDEVVAQAIIDGEYGEQRIASHVIRKMPGVDGTLPLSASFAFFGQRYTVDSHVFSNVVFDRVATRVLPNPLDAAFAAFGNDHAASLLATELVERPYAGALASMRTLVDAHPSEYWQGSLYTGWLGALRTLSSRAGGGEPGTAASTDAPGLPAVARTEGWARRLLNTQLGSWAQLRHDTILYAKQSYTVGTECEFPDAYVEPYPELFHALARFAERGQAHARSRPPGRERGARRAHHHLLHGPASHRGHAGRDGRAAAERHAPLCRARGVHQPGDPCRERRQRPALADGLVQGSLLQSRGGARPRPDHRRRAYRRGRRHAHPARSVGVTRGNGDAPADGRQHRHLRGAARLRGHRVRLSRAPRAGLQPPDGRGVAAKAPEHRARRRALARAGARRAVR